jgi:hypothetical protein
MSPPPAQTSLEQGKEILAKAMTIIDMLFPKAYGIDYTHPEVLAALIKCKNLLADAEANLSKPAPASAPSKK